MNRRKIKMGINAMIFENKDEYTDWIQNNCMRCKLEPICKSLHSMSIQIDMGSPVYLDYDEADALGYNPFEEWECGKAEIYEYFQDYAEENGDMEASDE